MANFKLVNKALRDEFPHLDVVAVRGEGYVYFDGKDGFDKVHSLYVHGPSTTTNELSRLVIEQVVEYLATYGRIQE